MKNENTKGSYTKYKGRVLRELKTIPGVGNSIAHDLWELGIRSIPDLKHRDPQRLYDKFCAIKGTPIDRCLLYVFRCAVYYASHTHHRSELLLWWNWKNRN
jgi:hypothetical protein